MHKAAKLAKQFIDARPKLRAFLGKAFLRRRPLAGSILPEKSRLSSELNRHYQTADYIRRRIREISANRTAGNQNPDDFYRHQARVDFYYKLLYANQERILYLRSHPEAAGKKAQKELPPFVPVNPKKAEPQAQDEPKPFSLTLKWSRQGGPAPMVEEAVTA